MAITIGPTLRNGRAAVVLDAIDAGTPAAYIELRDGTRPANPTVTATGVVRATITLANPAFPAPTTVDTAANGVPITVQAASDGTPTWFRVYDGDGTAVHDGSAGGSGSDAVISPSTLTAGQDVTLVSFVWTEPDGV